MERNLFGFRPAPLTTVEFAYKTDLTLDCYYFLVIKKGYPNNIYVKIGLDGEIKEMYPLYINSMKNSIEIIEKKLQYLGTYDFKHYAYMSWDMKNEPNEIYLPKSPNYIEKYKEDKLDAKYYTIHNLNELDNHECLTPEIKDFVRSENPDVFMYVIKNDKLKRFCNIFNFANDKYIEKREQISAFKDKWI